MKLTEKTRRTVVECVGIQCDVCGRRVDSEEVGEFQEVLSLDFTGGFAAILGDGNRFELDMCQHCVKQVLGSHLRLTHREGEPV